MTAQAARVLAHLKKWGPTDTDTNISTMTGIPRASVRRSMQELMREGVAVSFAGINGYTLAGVDTD